MRQLIVGLVIGASAVAFTQESELKAPRELIDAGDPISPSADLHGRVWAACVPGIRTEAELLAWLRGAASRQDGTVGMIGYVGHNGDAYVLSESMLNTREAK